MANLRASKKDKLPLKKKEAKNNKTKTSAGKSSFHVMSIEEMAKKETIPATAKEPSKYSVYRKQSIEFYVRSNKEPKIEVTKELVDREKGLWKIGLHAADSRAFASYPVLHEERIDINEIQLHERAAITKAYRPPWVPVEYLPKIIPHRIPDFRNRVTDLVRYTDMTGMQLLDYDANEALTMSYPWRCIGKIFTGTDAGWSGSWGTGVLVGPNLMMTASHLWPWGVPGAWMLFSPGFRDGRQHPDSFVTRIRGIKNEGSPTGYDYIICRLQKPLGEMLGWMGSQSFADEDDYTDRDWISVGYPGVFYNGNRPKADFFVGIRDIDNDAPGLEIETTYNTAFGGGWSGGPLWGAINNDFRIIGIKSGWEVDGYDPARGVFAGGTHMVDLVKFGLANFK